MVVSLQPRVVVLLVALVALVWPGAGVAQSTLPTGQHPPALEAQVDRWYLQAMDAIYQGRPSDADRIAVAMERAVPEDPRPYLLRARILRLDLPDQNEDRDGIGAKAEPIKRACEQALAAANAILERDPGSLAGHLYRGWASMFLAQVHALSNEYWGAGRKAAAGKSDLDYVLARDPGNPDALLVQGVYLYFADILPGMVKFARVFLRVPGGHRERGLEYIDAAAARHGYTELDAKALQGVLLFGFEGRLEEARLRFDAALEAYPDNARLVEPQAVTAFWFPHAMDATMRRTEETVQFVSNSPEQGERNVAARLQFYLALHEFLMGRVETARERLETLSRNLPEYPDWLEADVLRSLVDLDRILGEDDVARSRLTALPEKSPLRSRLYRVLQEPAPLEEERRRLLALQPQLGAMYAGALEGAASALEALAGQEGPALDFYRGELEMLRARPEAAEPYFARGAHAKGDGCWSWFRYVASLRLAEIQGGNGHFSTAATTLQKAMDSREQRDLLRHVTRARQRYYENGAGGTAGTRTAARQNGSPGASRAQSQ